MLTLWDANWEAFHPYMATKTVINRDNYGATWMNLQSWSIRIEWDNCRGGRFTIRCKEGGIQIHPFTLIDSTTTIHIVMVNNASAIVL